MLALFAVVGAGVINRISATTDTARVIKVMSFFMSCDIQDCVEMKERSPVVRVRVGGLSRFCLRYVRLLMYGIVRDAIALGL